MSRFQMPAVRVCLVRVTVIAPTSPQPKVRKSIEIARDECIASRAVHLWRPLRIPRLVAFCRVVTEAPGGLDV